VDGVEGDGSEGELAEGQSAGVCESLAPPDAALVEPSTRVTLIGDAAHPMSPFKVFPVESTEGVSQILLGRDYSRWAPSPFGGNSKFYLRV